MPASLPGETRTNNLANPSAGKFVNFDPLSGPKGSPLDAKTTTGYSASPVNAPVRVADPTNLSTGALSTGIGMVPGTPIDGPAASDVDIARAGFNDNMVPGKKILTYAAAPTKFTVATDEFNSTMMYIGGGRMIAGSAQDKLTGKPWIPSPYTAGVAIFGAGNGGSRDAGAGPAFTGFAMKMTTAAGAVAGGAVTETGFVNRSAYALATGQSTFASESAATAAPSMADAPEGDAPFSPPPFFTPEPQAERDATAKAKPRG